MPTLLWIVLPYSAFTCFIGGVLWRRRRDRAALAAGLPDDRAQGPAADAFRIAVATVICARIADLLAAGPHSHPHGVVYILICVAVLIGAPAAAISAALITVPQLIWGRSHRAVSPLDRLTLPLLAAALFCAVLIQFDPDAHNGRYRTAETLFAWFRSLWLLHPDPAPMRAAPLIYQVRGIIVALVIAVWPYSRLASVFAPPRWCRIPAPIRARLRALRLAVTPARLTTARRP